MAKIHGMFRSDNMAATTQGKYLASVKMNKDMDNGCVIALGDMASGEREIREFTQPTTKTAMGVLAVLCTPEVDPAVKYNAVGDFYNKNGSIARAIILEHQDIFSVTADVLDGTKALNDVVETKAGDHLNTAGSLTPSSTEVGKIIAIENDGATKWYVIRVK